MNPAGLKYQRFTAAVDVSGETMGFGQIKVRLACRIRLFFLTLVSAPALPYACTLQDSTYLPSTLLLCLAPPQNLGSKEEPALELASLVVLPEHRWIPPTACP